MKNYQKKLMALISAGVVMAGAVNASELKDDNGYTKRVQAREALKAATPWQKHAHEAMYWSTMGVSLGGQIMAPIAIALQPKALWPYAMIAAPSLAYQTTDNIVSGGGFAAGFVSSLALRALDSSYAYNYLTVKSGKPIYDPISLENAYRSYPYIKSIRNHQRATVFFRGAAIAGNAMSVAILGLNFVFAMPPRS